jgi:hypothetical protein
MKKYYSVNAIYQFKTNKNEVISSRRVVKTYKEAKKIFYYMILEKFKENTKLIEISILHHKHNDIITLDYIFVNRIMKTSEKNEPKS